MSEPTKAAIAAANVACAGMPELFTLGVAEIIDRETGLPELIAALRELMECVDVPAPNCSCHTCPPCADCVEYAGIREAMENGRDALRKAGEM